VSSIVNKLIQIGLPFPRSLVQRGRRSRWQERRGSRQANALCPSGECRYDIADIDSRLTGLGRLQGLDKGATATGGTHQERQVSSGAS
jgi:hypothetical protein